MSYLENAKTALQSLDSIYYKLGNYKTSFFWHRAEMIEMIEDAYEIINEEQYKTQLQEMCETAIKISTDSWIHNPFYDDVTWMCIAFARAAKILENSKYAEIAKSNLDYIYKNAAFEDGGMAWKKGIGSKHAVTSLPTIIASCFVADLFKDESYYERAIKEFTWIVENLFDQETGRIYDHIEEDGTTCYSYHSYLQGVFIGAATLLYEYTKEDKYKDWAELAINFTMQELYFDGKMSDPNVGDGVGFKAIFARWLRKYFTCFNDEKWKTWLQEQADVAWSNQNKYGLMQNNLYAKTADHKNFVALDCSAAVTVLINSI